jgi:hypothetical protein
MIGIDRVVGTTFTFRITDFQKFGIKGDTTWFINKKDQTGEAVRSIVLTTV